MKRLNRTEAHTEHHFVRTTSQKFACTLLLEQQPVSQCEKRHREIGENNNPACHRTHTSLIKKKLHSACNKGSKWTMGSKWTATYWINTNLGLQLADGALEILRNTRITLPVTTKSSRTNWSYKAPRSVNKTETRGRKNRKIPHLHTNLAIEIFVDFLKHKK